MTTLLVYPSKLIYKLKLYFAIFRISRILNLTVVKINKVNKVYGSKTNSYILICKNSSDVKVKYFLKFQPSNHTLNEYKGTEFLKEQIPVPKVILHNIQHGWILFEFIDGRLMIEEFLKAKSNSEVKKILDQESVKENLIRKLHSETTRKISYEDYVNTATNRLFQQRLFGAHYNLFYRQPEGVQKYFDCKIIINGKEFPYTINQIIDTIKNKYSHPHQLPITAIKSHGDAHHGNIIVNKKVWFIDNEYSGYTTPFMEMAKPYYNDLFGFLFFTNCRYLYKMFDIQVTKNTSKLDYKIRYLTGLYKFIECTKIKISKRKDTCNPYTMDPLHLNDYLVLCHLLTRNPNILPEKIKMLFIAFTVILFDFDPFDPDELESYFVSMK